MRLDNLRPVPIGTVDFITIILYSFNKGAICLIAFSICDTSIFPFFKSGVPIAINIMLLLKTASERESEK